MLAMKSSIIAAAVAILLTGLAIQAQAQSVPADLIGLPRCVWGKLKLDARTPMLKAVEASDAAGIDKALTDLKARTVMTAQGCSPSVALDHPTGDEVLLAGLRQEAAGELINRDLKLTRTQLDRALATAPAALTTALRKIANQLINRQTPDAVPSLSPLYTALRLPASGPANPRQASWLTTYAIGYHRVREQAAYFDPTPKE
jgi:hypothetical protein